MVFFTSILIITILYFLHEDGLIYVTVIALAAELINLFLTHTLTKTVEAKYKNQNRKAREGYLKRIRANQKAIKELEELQEDAARKLFKKNEEIKTLEEELKNLKATHPQKPAIQPTSPAKPTPKPQRKTPEKYIDLPDGSNRKRSRI